MTAATLHRRRYRGSDPIRRIAGWAVVVLVHVFVGWALLSGTARRDPETVAKPMEAAVIQEVIIPPPPPPPPKKIGRTEPKQPQQSRRPQQPRQPKSEAPPPPYVPPPEVTPPVSTSAVAVQSLPTPPVASPVLAPPPASPAPPGPAEIGVACPRQVPPDMPRQALREGIQGVVKAQALIKDGVVRDVTILSGPRVFHAPVRHAMLQYKCVSGPDDVIATQEFVFRIE